MSSWSQQDRDLVCTMWAMGENSRTIAERLCVHGHQVTRNAVMGMVDRLGLMGLGQPDTLRLRTFERVSSLFLMPFSLGEPLHREAALTLLVAGRRALREMEPLAIASGVDRTSTCRFLDRLGIVWPEGSPVPTRWAGGIEGNLAFILDMAVVSARLDTISRRPTDIALTARRNHAPPVPSSAESPAVMA